MEDTSEAILKAAEAGDSAQVAELLAANPKLAHVKGVHDKTPLHWAAEKNFQALAEALLAAGASLEAETTWGMTPLAWAANMGSGDVGELLLAAGSPLNMWIAAGLGMLEEVNSFFTPTGLREPAGQARSRQDAEGRWVKSPPPTEHRELVSDAFYIAARNGHVPVAEFLLEKGADVNYPGFFGAPGLHWAAINGHRGTIELLFARGADPNIRDAEFNSTALGWAKEGGHDEIAEQILRLGGVL